MDWRWYRGCVSLSTRFRPSVPLPVPVFAVTVYWLPLPLTLVIVAPVTAPVVARAKSEASTPVTLSLNTTVHDTLAAFVGRRAHSIDRLHRRRCRVDGTEGDGIVRAR